MAKETNQLVVKLFDALKKRGISVPKFSEVAGIPKDRVYKWKQDGTNPKADDEKIIAKWLNGEMEDVPRGGLKTSVLGRVYSHDALVSVMVSELAFLKAERTGEPVQLIIEKIYKAAEDVAKLQGG